jgi:LysM repeat protein
MLRRILIIALVVVVIIAAIFLIRGWLNRDTVTEDTPTDETAAVVEDNNAPEPPVVEEAPVDAGAPESEPVDSAAGGEEAVPPAEGESGQGAAAYPGGDDSGAAPADSAGGEADTAAPADDANMGGVNEAGDADVGGGAPPAEGEAAAEAPAAEDAAPADSGNGGVPPNANTLAVVQPGVPVQHEVKNLEWLTQLARCYGTTVQDIQAANNGYPYPDLIYPGWIVNINNPGNAGPITINDTPCFNYHTVQQGETLYSIATQYGIHYEWLARINAIYNYDYIYAGQTLVIPNPVDPVLTQPPVPPYYPVYPVPYGQ